MGCDNALTNQRGCPVRIVERVVPLVLVPEGQFSGVEVQDFRQGLAQVTGKPQAEMQKSRPLDQFFAWSSAALPIRFSLRVLRYSRITTSGFLVLRISSPSAMGPRGLPSSSHRL